MPGSLLTYSPDLVFFANCPSTVDRINLTIQSTSNGIVWN